MVMKNKWLTGNPRSRWGYIVSSENELAGIFQVDYKPKKTAKKTAKKIRRRGK